MLFKSYLSALLFSLARSSSELHGKYLSGFTFASLDKMGKQMCVRECQSYPGRCKSVNYNRVHLSCELNTDSATDKPEAVLDREGSTYIPISTFANNSVCGDIQCSSKEKCVVTKSRSTCIFQGCDMPRVKNAEFNGGVLMYRKSMQCKTGYISMTSLTCTERGLDKDATEFKCYKEVDGWTLIYRGQTGGTDSDYLSFVSNGTSDENNENVKDEYCTSTTKSPLCTTNYRTSLIDRWQSLGNFKVNVSLYKNGTKVAEVVFNGTGTSQESWFSPSQILSSTWSDVTVNQTYKYFSLEGDVAPCTLPPQRVNPSQNVTEQSIIMTTSKSNIDISELHSGKETTSRYLGILSEAENTNGTHYQTLQERQLDASQYPSNYYDTCTTAERIKEHAEDNWNVTRHSGMYALPGDSHQDAQRTTMVTLNTAQSSLRPYNLVEHEANTDQRQSVHQNNYFTLKPMCAS